MNGGIFPLSPFLLLEKCSIERKKPTMGTIFLGFKVEASENLGTSPQKRTGHTENRELSKKALHPQSLT